MHGFQLKTLCLVLFGSVAVAAEAPPGTPRSDNPQEWQAQNLNRPYYPPQGFAPPRGQAPRYRPMETHPAAPAQYGEYPANRAPAPYGYPEHSPSQEYYPAYPPSDDSGNAYYYPTTPEYGPGYPEPQPYSYPYVYQQAPDYGGYPVQPGYEYQPGYDYQPGYQEGGYYPQPDPGAAYGERYTAPAYDYPAPAYPADSYPQAEIQAYPPPATSGRSESPGQTYAPPSYPRDYPVAPSADSAAGYAAQPLKPEQRWPAAEQPPAAAGPAPGQTTGYMVNGEPAVFRPWSEPTTDTLTSQQNPPPANE